MRASLTRSQRDYQASRDTNPGSSSTYRPVASATRASPQPRFFPRLPSGALSFETLLQPRAQLYGVRKPTALASASAFTPARARSRAHAHGVTPFTLRRFLDDPLPVYTPNWPVTQDEDDTDNDTDNDTDDTDEYQSASTIDSEESRSITAFYSNGETQAIDSDKSQHNSAVDSDDESRSNSIITISSDDEEESYVMARPKTTSVAGSMKRGRSKSVKKTGLVATMNPAKKRTRSPSRESENQERATKVQKQDINVTAINTRVKVEETSATKLKLKPRPFFPNPTKGEIITKPMNEVIEISDDEDIPLIHPASRRGFCSSKANIGPAITPTPLNNKLRVSTPERLVAEAPGPSHAERSEVIKRDAEIETLNAKITKMTECWHNDSWQLASVKHNLDQRDREMKVLKAHIARIEDKTEATQKQHVRDLHDLRATQTVTDSVASDALDRLREWILNIVEKKDEELHQLEQRLTASEQKVDDLEMEIEDKEAEIAHLGALLETDKPTDQLQQQLVASEQKVDDLKTKIEAKEAEITQLANLLAAPDPSSQSNLQFPDSASSLKASNSRVVNMARPLTPSLSGESNGLQTRTDNVRKTYIKVKRRYDNLRSAAANIVQSTRGLDLTCFGEYGHYIKTLRNVLDEEK
ncbi:hypothetical protein P280DRAFT_549075 [Massarina eburnea CBS 473.64]|uniref:Uncharacterized protein n=1 Tax=Massarina eburnea CBS 473.64 TaxID=1395130 RepID=A0A6A6S2H9_9PLEO|nr:hypothetical protein P280DRAFT_549075 [Massarina eburnea CBS 473.64]